MHATYDGRRKRHCQVAVPIDQPILEDVRLGPSSFGMGNVKGSKGINLPPEIYNRFASLQYST